jgi:hypothetical protein
MKLFVLSLLVFGLSAMAADVSGKWKGTADTPNGTVERTFLFKVDGTKLTGETESQMMGKSTIADGKVEGDTITFSINVKFQDNDMKLNYKGVVSGDEIKFTLDIPNVGQTLEYTAKRVS